jgi:hypothetical protein
MVAPGWGTLIGAGVGALGGAIGGMGAAQAQKAQQRALQEQQDAIRNEVTRRAQGVADTRAKFGDLWSSEVGGAGGLHVGAPIGPGGSQDLGKTLESHSLISGEIEGQAGAARDLGRIGLTDTAQQAAAAVRGSSAARGLAGSSLDESNRKMLLGHYAGGRANLAAGTEQARQSGTNAIQTQQQGMENLIGGGGDISGQLRSLSTAGAIAGAAGQIAPTAWGNLFNTGIGLVGQGAKAEAGGGLGVQALGLPALGVAPNKTSGAYASPARKP